MIAKFAVIISQVASEFRDLNRASWHVLRVSPVRPALALYSAAGTGELRPRDTRAMIAKFAVIISQVASEFRDLDRASWHVLRVLPTGSKLAQPSVSGR